MPDSKPAQKDLYKLWWEFLKLCEEYISYCNHRKNLESNPKLEMPKKFVPGYPQLLDINFINNVGLPQWFIDTLDIKKGILPGHVAYTFAVFGNVLDKEFDKFWNDNGKYLASEDSQAIEAVSDFSATFDKILAEYNTTLTLAKSYDSLHSEIKNELLLELGDRIKCVDDLKPSLEGFIRFFKHRLNCEFIEERHITINLLQTKGEIDKCLKKYYSNDERKKIDPTKSNLRYIRCWNQKPGPYIKYDELCRYYTVLSAYGQSDSHKDLAFNNVMECVQYPGYSKAIFTKDLAKAQRIANNAARGYFPGIYEKIAPTYTDYGSPK